MWSHMGHEIVLMRPPKRLGFTISPLIPSLRRNPNMGFDLPTASMKMQPLIVSSYGD
jgi:hypothetical protein